MQRLLSENNEHGSAAYAPCHSPDALLLCYQVESSSGDKQSEEKLVELSPFDTQHTASSCSTGTRVKGSA